MQLSIPVFISSKQSELAVERDLMADQIRRMPPLEPIIAEEWSPQAKRVQEVMLDKVRMSPIYIGLFAAVYSKPTELEYREACKNPYREILIYVKAAADRDAQLAALIETMQDAHVMTKYVDVRDLLHRFENHLRDTMSRMILLLQKLGEEKPVSRSGKISRLSDRWAEEQKLLNEFALAKFKPDQRYDIITALKRNVEVIP